MKKSLALLAAGAALALAAGCGGDDATATPAPTATRAAVAQPTATSAPQPTATSAPAPLPTSVAVVGAQTTPTPTVAAASKVDVPAPKSPAGTLTWAWTKLDPGPGINSSQAPELMMSFGITELFFRQSKANPVEPWLATGWDLASDLSKISIKFRTGVKFHKGWGNLTAADVAWSLNDTNATTNPQSIHGQAGDYAPLFKEAKAVDAQTLEIPLVQYDVRFASYFMNQAGDGFGIFSKKVFDEKGADWMKENIIATGPFIATEWRRDDRVVMVANPDHWEKVPAVKNIRIINVPEAQSRVAMMLTGEADLAPLQTKDLVDLAKVGFVVAGTGRAWHVSIPMAGNYWEKTHAITKAPLDTAGLYNNNLPWQGNPNDPKDLEQSRLVRTALAMSINRAAIARESYAGIAKPHYIGGFFANDANWQSKWEFKYDTAGAEQLLEQAGFKKNARGVRFEMPVFGQTNSQLFFDVSEIVAGEWRKIGVDTQVLHYSYSVFRPTAVQRSNTTPIVMTCRQNNGGAPWDWPRLEEYTSLTCGGFGCSMEIPKFLEIYNKTSVEPDAQKRIALNNEAAQYMYDQALEIGVITVPDAIAYNPKAIKSWDMRPGIFMVVNSPENIIPAR